MYMKFSYFTGSGQELAHDEYQWSDIKLSSKKINHIVRTPVIQEATISNLFNAV
jgi:hypothetical protein